MNPSRKTLKTQLAKFAEAAKAKKTSSKPKATKSKKTKTKKTKVKTPEQAEKAEPKPEPKPEPEQAKVKVPHTSIDALKKQIALQNEQLKEYDEYKTLERSMRKSTFIDEKARLRRRMTNMNLSAASRNMLHAIDISRSANIAQLATMENRSTPYQYTQTNNELIRVYQIPVNQRIEDVDAEAQYHAIAEFLERHVGRNKAMVSFNIATHDGKIVTTNLSPKPFWINTYDEVPTEAAIADFISQLKFSPGENGNETDYNDPRNELASIVIKIFHPYAFGRGFDKRYIDPALLANKSVFCVPNNVDNNCFQHALIILVDGAKSKSNKVAMYETTEYKTKIAEEFWAKLDHLKGPMYPTSKTIEEVELILQTNINIYSYPCAKPIRQSKFSFEKTSNLLLYTNGSYAHYCAILNLNAFLRPYDSRQALTCQHCNQTFSRSPKRNLQAEFNEHVKACAGETQTAYRYIQMTYDKEKITYSSEVINYVIYCDFEATTDGDSHHAFSFGVNLVFTAEDYSEVISSATVVDPNESRLMKKFYEILLHYQMTIVEKLAKTYPIHGLVPPRPKDCSNCHKPSTNLVRDHDHYKKENNFRAWLCGPCNSKKRVNKVVAPKLNTKRSSGRCKKCHREGGFEALCPRYHPNTGNFIGEYHLECLQKLNEKHNYSKRVIPVIAHNSSSYDNCFMTKYYNLPFNMFALPKNSQSFISWSAGPFRFLDSYRFWASSLKNMFDSLESTPITDSFVNGDENVAALLKSKMVFPYEFFKHDKIAEQLNQTTFPTQDEFYSSLNKSNVSEKDYNDAKNFFTAKCKTMSDFVRLYQRADVVQLADSIEFLRRSVRNKFDVEPLHSISAPGFSFNCFINVASEYFKKNFPDAPPFEISSLPYEQLEFFSQIRGGISTAIKRHAHRDDGELVYYDANSLYPSAMRSYMPYSNFEIMTTLPTLDEILNLPDEGDVGYQLMIDIPKQTKEFQDFWIDMPPIISHLAPDPERLSVWQKAHLSENYKPSEKLLGTFLEHKGYTIHYRLLKFLLQHGFKCTITRAIKFYQVPFIRGFVELGAKLRTMSSEAKQIWKLVMNSVYGKFLQSELKQSSCITTSDIDLIRKRILSPFFKDLIQINDRIFTILMAKETVDFKSCRHIGAVILDESKLIMFKHYANVKTKFPGANLLYTDTDSHVWQFPKGVSRDMIYKELPFDHSGLPKENKHHNNDHKGELGYVKDEHPELTEIVALASKIYSLIDGGKTTNHAKGISTRFVKNELTFDDYKEALHGKVLDPVKTQGFQSVNHVLTTVTKVKKNISNFDDKRYILDDGISTIPYGHYSLEESEVAKVNHQKVIEEKLKWYSTFMPTASTDLDEPEKTEKGRSPELQAQINAKAARTRAIKKVVDAQKNFDAVPSEANKKALDAATENLKKAEENLKKAEEIFAELEKKEEKKTVKGRTPEFQAQINAKAARTRAINKAVDAQKKFDADPSENNKKALDAAEENLEKAEENLEKASKVLTELKNKEEEEREEERLHGGILSNWRKDEDEEIVL